MAKKKGQAAYFDKPIYIPPPEEIEKECKKIRERNYRDRGHDDGVVPFEVQAYTSDAEGHMTPCVPL